MTRLARGSRRSVAFCAALALAAPAHPQSAAGEAGSVTITPAPESDAGPGVNELLVRLEKLSEELAATHEELQRRGVAQNPAAGKQEDAVQALRLLRADYAAQAARLRAAQTAATQAQRAHEQMAAQVVDLRRAIVAAERENAALRDARAAGTGSDARLQTLSEDLAQTRQALEAALTSAQADHAKEVQRRETAEKERAEALTRIEALERQLAEARNVVEPLLREKQRLEQALAEARRAPPPPAQVAPDDRLQTLTAQLQERESELEQVRIQAAETERQLRLEQTRLGTLDEENRVLRERQERMTRQLEQLGEQVAELQQRNDRLVQSTAREPGIPIVPVVEAADATSEPIASSSVAAPARTAPTAVAPRDPLPTYERPSSSVSEVSPSAPIFEPPVVVSQPSVSPWPPAGDTRGRVRLPPTRPSEVPPGFFAAAAAATPALPAAPPPARDRYHVVQFGDSLTRISVQYFNTSRRWEDIYEANRDILSNPNHVRVGQRLRIPGR